MPFYITNPIAEIQLTSQQPVRNFWIHANSSINWGKLIETRKIGKYGKIETYKHVDGMIKDYYRIVFKNEKWDKYEKTYPKQEFYKKLYELNEITEEEMILELL